MFCHFLTWGPKIMDSFSLYLFRSCKPPMFGRIWGTNLGGTWSTISGKPNGQAQAQSMVYVHIQRAGC